MPSGFGARARTMSIAAVATGLSLATAARFSGDQAGIVLTSVGIPADAVAQVDGVTQAVSVRNSSTQITFTLSKVHTRTRGTKLVTWYSPSSNTSSLPSNFVVTEVLTAEYDNGLVSSLTLSGAQVTSQADLSPNNFTRVSNAFAVNYASNIQNGRGGLTAPNSSANLRSSGTTNVCTAMANVAGATMIRAIKTVTAAVAGRGVGGIYLFDAAGNNMWIGGYSGLIATAKWAIGSQSTARRGATGWSYAAGEAYIESISTRNNSHADLRKNNGALITFDVSNSGTAPLGPNSSTLGTGKYADFYFSDANGTLYILYEMYANYDMTAAEVAEACAYIGGLEAIAVS